MNCFVIFYLTITFILTGMYFFPTSRYVSFSFSEWLFINDVHCTLPRNIFKLINELFEIEKGTCAVELTFLVDGSSDGKSGEITSPGYPANYPDNVNYTWILRTGHLNANMTFTILDSDISEPYFPPCDDYLQVRKATSPCQTPFYTNYRHRNPTHIM